MATAFEHRRGIEAESTGAAVEAVGGLCVVVLGILGLAGLVPILLAAIAGIIFGVAQIAEGGAVATEYSRLFERAGGPAGTELGGDISFGAMIGGAVIVLGVLALIGLAPMVLIPAFVIVAGAALIISAGATQTLSGLRMETAGASDLAQRIARGASAGTAGLRFLAGAAAIVLGIIALVSLPTGAGTAQAIAGVWLTLSLVGLLVIGFVTMVSGGALSGRMWRPFSRD